MAGLPYLMRPVTGMRRPKNPVPGRDLVTSLDARVQARAGQDLATQMAAIQSVQLHGAGDARDEDGQDDKQLREQHRGPCALPGLHCLPPGLSRGHVTDSPRPHDPLAAGAAAEGHATDPARTTEPAQLICRSRPAQYCSRSLNFCTLPVAVRGISSRSSIDVGAL